MIYVLVAFHNHTEEYFPLGYTAATLTLLLLYVCIINDSVIVNCVGSQIVIPSGLGCPAWESVLPNRLPEAEIGDELVPDAPWNPDESLKDVKTDSYGVLFLKSSVLMGENDYETQGRFHGGFGLLGSSPTALA